MQVAGMQGHQGFGDAGDLGMWGHWRPLMVPRAISPHLSQPCWGWVLTQGPGLLGHLGTHGFCQALGTSYGSGHHPVGQRPGALVTGGPAGCRVGWHHARVLGTPSCHCHGSCAAIALPCPCPLLSPGLAPHPEQQDTGLGTDPLFARAWVQDGRDAWARGWRGHGVGLGMAWAPRQRGHRVGTARARR